ncbi:MAG: T9SS-dependent M36 family metallopeptidase [Saprospiraceae bacterium]|nr:T9SS-dependent M36 family metallopeptidase [Saprospiraceae bacterium]MCF8251001.1 T9SS-dependent M36 family metallopeptidase [Saprospiraceae bacterium]MCF8282816.1 T9SS-dependent M36 family metallopeptidase [Bacteroidales bacterium]MCF8311598.1 T9SS-dependent M36 family metallopeptidase [Saprospiraceae bacterium]MCF8440939.1 T9SS-dependent M36 family metallopeptidase [Saprospiraceae bacterium]
MKFKSTKQFGLIMACLLVGASAFAQLRTPVDIATAHVNSHYAEWGLTAQDIDGMTVSDQYTDPTTGIARVFFMQRYQGIPVYNAIQNISITADGKVFHVGKRFVPNLSTKVNNTIPVLDAEAAVVKLMQHLDIPYAPIRLIGQDDKGSFVFEKGTVAQENIKARLSFQQYGSVVLLAWDISLVPVKSSDMWSCRVDAVTGDLLDKANWTVYCKVDHTAFMHTEKNCDAVANHNHKSVTSSFNTAAAGSYNVWPSPVESPIHGTRQMVVDPHDLTASPHGWHDTNGQAGPEYTITRGNNVHAYEDSGDTNGSIDNEPDGGPSLVFDFPYDALNEPVTYTNAAVVNLFYWNNIMHDLSYSYGMTEAAGAFQSNNYGNGGAGNDFVNAEAQDGGGTNNANFSTPADGGNGRMQMYLWDGGQVGEVFNVLEPASVAGGYSSVQPATGWGVGAYASQAGVTAEVAIVQDALANDLFSDACEEILNVTELTGKIALIDRGGCEFGFKALAAQNAGAVGVIICNFEDATIGMGGGAVGGQVEIPTIMMTSVNCQTIRQFAGNGLVASIKLPDLPMGPAQLDGDLDNGIVAHEYGHGISNRLTGGPGQAGCLSNAEQMGEGWSDWFSMITTVEAGDTGTDKRGVGTYAIAEPANGGGIRRYPYSTDMAVNPLTYADVATNQEVHALGEVWTAMVWDLYWAFVDEYGWNADLYHGTGGNNMAIRLVYDGMKNQPCNPGFLDGRDGIIAADLAINNGVNKCMIWKVFARRGAGLSALQGSSGNAGDQVEAFDIPCECRDELTVTKSVTDFINPGDDIQVTVNVSNCKLETRTNVIVSDHLPDGTSFKAGSANVPATVTGNTLTLQVGDIDFEQTKTITYTLTTDPGKYSIRYFLDDVPDADAEDNWNIDFEANAPSINIFEIQDVSFNSPEFAWAAPEILTESRAILELITPWTVVGNRPVLRFYHAFDTEAGVDAGFIEVKRPNENSFVKVADKMLRNGYTGGVSYGEAFVIPNLEGWSGTSNGEFISTYVDMSDWAGGDVVFRFRFGTNDGIAGAGDNPGWTVDDIEFMDMLNYNGEVCVTTAQGDNECVIAPEEGTIVESQFFSSTVETLADMTMTVFPNPARDMLNISLTAESQKDVNLSLLTIDGRVMMERKANVLGNGHFELNVSQLPAGFYLVKVATEEGVMVTKVVVD